MTAWQKLKTKRWFHWTWVVLFFVGTLEYAYECSTGSGVSGWLMRWQIERFGRLSVGMWGAFWLFPTIVLPFIMAAGTSQPKIDPSRTIQRGPLFIFGGIILSLVLMSAGAYWVGAQLPELEAVPLKLEVAKSSGTVKEGMTQLSGVAQNEQGFRFVASWTTGSGSTAVSESEYRSVVPVTPPQWLPGEPVRFLIAAKVAHLRTGPLPPGVLLANSLPWYQRSVLSRRGVRLTEPYYVLYTNAYSETKGNWDAMAAICGFFAVVLLLILIGISWPEGKKQR